MSLTGFQRTIFSLKPLEFADLLISFWPKFLEAADPLGFWDLLVVAVQISPVFSVLPVAFWSGPPDTPVMLINL